MKPYGKKMPPQVKVERPVDQITGSAHDFTGNLEEWEQRVFTAACTGGGHFTVWQRSSTPGEGSRKDFTSFPEAALFAYPNPRHLVYAVTNTGRSFCIERKHWQHYLDLCKTLIGESKQDR